MADSLKPGGLLLLADGDWVAYDQSKQLVLPVEYDKDTRKVIADGSRSWYAGWLSLAGLGTRSSEYQRIDQLVKGCEDFNEGDSKFCSYYSPINWSGNDITDGEELGKILDVNQRAFLSASKGTLRKIGIPEETIEEWAEHYQEDLDNKHYYNIWYYMTARKSVCV
ncbi:hypothetical protein PQX77_016105 [Marasmius sp. AFHP31]|nr:hypothetical protein PQX77_016105 [Marasmius sp. AFHP31]